MDGKENEINVPSEPMAEYPPMEYPRNALETGNPGE